MGLCLKVPVCQKGVLVLESAMFVKGESKGRLYY
jgi:hypothetical protein